MSNKSITPIHFYPKYCSQCGSSLQNKFIEEENCERLYCIQCKHIEYLNPKVVAGAIPIKNGKIVLLKRGIEPRKGTWTFPAGFVELGETIPEGAVRETKEETGIEIKTTDIVGIYSYKDAGVATIVYTAEVIGGKPEHTKEALEVKEFSINEIPWEDLAFRSTHDALKDFEKIIQKTL